MVDAFSVDQPRNVEVVPLVGGLSTIASLTSGEELVRELAGRLGATFRYLHAPGLLRSKTARDSLLAEPAVAEVLERAQAADIAMVGIGGVETGSSKDIIDGLGLTPAEREAFVAEGPRRRRLLPVLRRAGPGDQRGGPRPRAGDRARPAPPDPDGHRRGHGVGEAAGRARCAPQRADRRPGRRRRPRAGPAERDQRTSRPARRASSAAAAPGPRPG